MSYQKSVSGGGGVKKLHGNFCNRSTELICGLLAHSNGKMRELKSESIVLFAYSLVYMTTFKADTNKNMK